MYIITHTQKMKDRIKNFIDAKGISAGELATILDVQRSNISHILNGRNKPGAAFIEKLLIEFPELNARWLLTGEGDMFEGNITRPEVPVTQLPLPDKKETEVKEKVTEPAIKKEDKSAEIHPSVSNDVDKMVIIYRDGTFNIYKQR